MPYSLKFKYSLNILFCSPEVRYESRNDHGDEGSEHVQHEDLLPANLVGQGAHGDAGNDHAFRKKYNQI